MKGKLHQFLRRLAVTNWRVKIEEFEWVKTMESNPYTLYFSFFLKWYQVTERVDHFPDE
jgi:hypothetical protein